MAKATHWHLKVSDRLINGPVLLLEHLDTAEAAVRRWESWARGVREVGGEEITSYGSKALRLGDPWVGCFGEPARVDGRMDRVVRWVVAYGCADAH